MASTEVIDNAALKAQLEYSFGVIRRLENDLSMTRTTCCLMQREEDRLRTIIADLTVENMDLRAVDVADIKSDVTVTSETDNMKRTINKQEKQITDLSNRVDKLSKTNKEIVNENKTLQAKADSAGALANKTSEKIKQLEMTVVERMAEIKILVDQLKELRRENYIMAGNLSIAEAFMRAHEQSGHICGVTGKKSE